MGWRAPAGGTIPGRTGGNTGTGRESGFFSNLFSPAHLFVHVLTVKDAPFRAPIGDRAGQGVYLAPNNRFHFVFLVEFRRDRSPRLAEKSFLGLERFDELPLDEALHQKMRDMRYSLVAQSHRTISRSSASFRLVRSKSFR